MSEDKTYYTPSDNDGMEPGKIYQPRMVDGEFQMVEATAKPRKSKPVSKSGWTRNINPFVRENLDIGGVTSAVTNYLENRHCLHLDNPEDIDLTTEVSIERLIDDLEPFVNDWKAMRNRQRGLQ